MTREEAINKLTNARYADEFQGDEELTTAHLMAIKALEQGPCEDCVSRQAMLDLAETIQTDDFSGNEILDVVEVNDIKDLPPVIPTRKKGKWIFTKTIFDKHGYTVECSSCYKKWKTYDEIRWRKENKYCPNCGAEMESEE